MGLFSFLKPKKKGVPKASRGSQGGIIGGDEIQGFLDDEELIFVTSSNHVAAQYFGDTGQLMIEFHDGAAYLFSDISREEAEDYARAPSKGTWGIDYLIGRENLKGHAHWHGGPSLKPVKKLR